MIDVRTVDKWPEDVGRLANGTPVAFLLHTVVKNNVNLNSDAPDFHLFLPNGCLSEDGKQFAAVASSKDMAVKIALRELRKRYVLIED